MIVLTCFGFLAVFQLAASSTQNPTLTQCPGKKIKHPAIEIESVTIDDAELGKTVKIDTNVVVHESLDDNPVLHISYEKQSGGNLTCIPNIFPCNLKLCNGTTKGEKELNKDWNNECPIPPGTYTAHFMMHVPDTDAAKEYIGDGNLIVTLMVVNGGKVEECVSFPVSIQTD